MAFSVSERWEDSYSYLLSAQSSITTGYGGFFGRLQHPLYTAILYIFAKIVGNAFIGAKLLALVAYFVTVLFLFKIMNRAGNRGAAILPVIFCSIVTLDYFNYSLAVLSGPLFTAILMAGFYYLLRQKYVTAGLLIGMLAMLRAEYILILISCIIILAALRGLRHILSFSLVNVPFVVIFVMLLMKVPSAGKEVVDRFGNRSIWETSQQAFIKFSHILFGGQAINSGIVLLILLFAFGWAAYSFFKSGRKKWGDTNRFEIILFSSLFLFMNFAALVLLNFMGSHPLAVRHLGYLVPFVSLCVVCFLVEIETRFMPFTIVGLSGGSLLLLVLMSVLTFMPYSFNPKGRLFTLEHWMDESKATAAWLSDNVNKGENIVSVLPSPIFFSGLPLSQWHGHYPKNILDRDKYYKESIKYVVWSNIYAGQNLAALDKLGGLGSGQDFLFFKHLYTPPDSNAWNTVIYSVGEKGSIVDGLNYNAVLGTGWYGQEKWGRWASNQVSLIRLNSFVDQPLILEFEAGAFHEKAMLQVKINGSEYAQYNIELKRGDVTTPTIIRMPFHVTAGETQIELIGPQEAFRPVDVGGWRDRRKLRMAYSHMFIRQKDGRMLRVF